MIALAIAGAMALHPAQAAVFGPATDPEGPRVVIARAGIRGGKTEVGALAAIVRAITMPTDEDECHAVVSPTFPMSKLGPESKLKKILADPKIFPVSPLINHAKSERALYIASHGGKTSRIRIFSGEDPDRWRGDKWRSAWLDEGAYLTPEARDVALGRLADTVGQLVVTSSPDGMNWVSELSAEATEGTVGYVRRDDGRRVPFHVRRAPDGHIFECEWSSFANPFIPSQAFDDLRKRYDPDTFAQEIEAQYVARSGRVYRYFDRTKHVAALPFNPDGVVLVGQDFNVARMATVFMQETARGGLHVIDEKELRDSDTYRLVAFLDEWRARRNLPKDALRVIPDASGRKRQTAASDTAKSDIQIIEKSGYRVDAPRGNPRVKDRVNCVNGLFHSTRLTIDPKCALLIEALEKQPWGEDGEPEKDGVLDNRTDALGYPCWRKYPLSRTTVLAQLGTRRAA